MMGYIKKGLLLLGAAFAIFYLISNPVGSADLVKMIAGGLSSIPVFFEALVS